MELKGIDHLGIQRVLQRGSGVVLEERDDALLVFDTVSEAYFLACPDSDTARAMLEQYRESCRLLMTDDIHTGRILYAEYGFADKLECYQTAWYGPVPSVSSPLRIRPAAAEDLPVLTAVYDLITPEEMAKVIARGCLFLGYEDGHLAGFAGEHLEGSMGLLYILPEYRKRGYGEALERYMIAETMHRGFLPFGQVERHNTASLALQKKIGMTVSDRLICWMWK